MRSPEWRRVLALLALLLGSAEALAHGRSVSYSSWRLDGETLQLQLRLPAVELNRAGYDPRDPDLPQQLAARIDGDFRPAGASQPCRLLEATGRRAGTELRIDARWQCPERPQTLAARFLRDRVPGHLHLLQWREGDRLAGPWALGPGLEQVALPAPAAAMAPTFGRYLRLGAEHILQGWDHLAYLLMLLLGARAFGPLAWRITGFTLGHSLTLLLASRGWVRPEATMVEAFIALTIVCVAAERTLDGQRGAAGHVALIAGTLGLVGWWAGALPLALALAAVLLSAGALVAHDQRLEALRTTVFGLFHGLGFAAVLGELDASPAVPALPLLGFNLGVEAGQLLFVLPLWLLARRYPLLRHRLVPAAALALGSFWFLGRLV